MLQRKTITSGVLAILLIVLVTTAASGQTSWNNTLGGAFNVAANWTPAVVPGSTTGVIFGLSSPGYVVTMDTSRWTSYVQINNDTVTIDLKGYSYLLFNSGLWVGYNAGNAGILTLQNGSFECTNSYLASGVGSRGSVQVGANTWWKNNQTMNVGVSGAGQVSVSGGGTVTGASAAMLGQNAGSSGTVIVDGLNSLWSMSQGLTVGNNGAGNLIVRSGGRVQTGASSTIAGAPGVTSSALVDGAGSQWTNGSTLTVGVYGAGSLAIRNGGLVSNTAAIIGASAGATGDVTVDGAGSTWSQSSDLYIATVGTGTLTLTNGGKVTSATGSVGDSAGALGTVSIVGGSAAWTCAGALAVGKSGAGNVAVTSGGRLSSTTAVLGTNSGAAGAVIVDGPGSSWTTGDLDVGKGGYGRLTVSGGASATCGAVTVGRTAGSSGDVFITGNGSLWSPGGSLYLGGSSTTDASTPASLTVGSGSTVRVGGTTVQVWSRGSLLMDGGTLAYTSAAPGVTNAGLIEGRGRIAAALNNSPTGRVSVTQPGDHLTFASPSASHQNAGEIALSGGIVEFQKAVTNTSTGFISGQGTIIAGGGLTNTGSIGLSGGFTDVYGDVANNSDGKIIVSGGSATTFYDDVVINSGSTFRVSDGCSATFFGSLSGKVNITGGGTVYEEGDLRPGFSAAAISFGGKLVLGSSSSTNIELGGTTPGDQYDTITVTDKLTMGGTLNITLINEFVPAHNNAFQILTYGSKAGAFSAVNGLNIGPRLNLVPTTTDTSMTLTAVQGGPGEWRSAADHNASVGTNWTGGRPNGIGDVATFGSIIPTTKDVHIDVPTVFGSMVFADTNNYAVAGLAALTLQNTGGSHAAVTVNNSGGGAGHNVSANVTLASPLDVNVASGAAITFSGTVGNTGSMAITKSGDGTLVLGGANAYGGGTTLSEGTLLVNNVSGSGTGAGTVTVGAATLGGTGFINGPVTLTGGSTLTSTGTLTIKSTLTVQGLANQLSSGMVNTSGDVTIDHDAVFIINGTLGGEDGSLIVRGTLMGKGTINKACILDGGTLSPGEPSTIKSMPQVRAAATPKNFSFEIGAAGPNYASPSNSVNDVIRLTDAATPFADASGAAPAALTADTVINVYFLWSDPGLGAYKAEFFAAKDFSDAVAGATYEYWRLDPRGSRYHNGNFFSPLDPALVDWSVVPETATFDGRAASGYITEFSVAPEPATLALLALGAVAVLRRRK